MGGAAGHETTRDRETAHCVVTRGRGLLGPRPSRDSFTKDGLVSNVGCAESACSENG